MAKLERFKPLKRSRDNCSSSDRISSLPEHLLSHILSSLPTKSAVATSLLSTRWKFLWTSITNLNFESSQSRCTKKVANMKRQNFTRFVNRVLLLLDPPFTQRFRLKCHHEHCDPSYINSWICAAIVRTVQELDLSLKLEKPIDFPLSRSYSKMLAVLELKGDLHFNIPPSASICFPSLQTLRLSAIIITIASDSSVGFPSLKVLHLEWVNYANKESSHKPFGSCPVLDNRVTMQTCSDIVVCLTICIPSLRSLTIGLWGFEDREYKLQMDTPALQYLNVEGDLMYEYLAGGILSSLLDAKVKFYFDNKKYIDVNSYSIKVFKFIEGLSKVKSLSVSGGTLRVIKFASSNILPDFRNLTRLELARDNCPDWCVVIKRLLESMDNLEHLFMKGNYCRGSHKAWWTEPLHVPKCLLSRVTTISFSVMIGDCHDELEMLRYFLKNAQVLELLTLHFGAFRSSDKIFELVEKISMFPRGSPTCQVAFT